MRTEFRKAVVPREIQGLKAFDHRVFARADWFSREDWQTYESWWMIVEGRKVGCCAFARHADFQEDVCEDRTLRGSLYIASTGILPQARGRGFGTLLKSWQIAYARYHGFKRIVTNTRKSNKAMIRLNRRFGFRVLRTTTDYYDDPQEETVVMELRL